MKTIHYRPYRLSTRLARLPRQAERYLTVLFIVLIFIFFNANSFAQFSSDCPTAVPVCNSVYDVPVLSPSPNNIPNEINPTLSCLSSGETNGNWYTFTVQTDGMLIFNIIPYGKVDYDWAVFNLTNASCADIATDPSLQVACNFSSSVTNNAITGANGGPNLQDEPPIPVLAGQTYVLYVSNYNFSSNSSGYKLDFTGSTAQVPDNVPPKLVSATPSSSCKASSIRLKFNENILCSSVTPSDFSITGPSGAVHNVTSINGCGPGAYSNEFSLVISPPMVQGGNYHLDIIGGVSDVCGNVLSGGLGLDINYQSLSVQLTKTDSDCPVADGTATANILSGSGPFTFQWNDPLKQTTQTATGLPRGWYTVTVTDGNGCKYTDSIRVNDPTSFTLDVQQSPDTCGKGVGILEAIVNGVTGPYTYVWEHGIPSGNFYFNGIGDSLYHLKVTDMQGCWLDTTVRMVNEVNDSIIAYFVTDKDKVNFLSPRVYFYNQSQYANTVTWEIGTYTTNAHSFFYDFEQIGEFPVTLRAYDINGCMAVYTASIKVFYELAFYIPNAFTPNGDGLNERFSCTGIGLDEKKFRMFIYDRWGHVIFETDNMTTGWDGNDPNGKPMPAGSYVWRVEAHELKGDLHVFHGRVQLIR